MKDATVGGTVHIGGYEGIVRYVGSCGCDVWIRDASGARVLYSFSWPTLKSYGVGDGNAPRARKVETV
jgi:hypothetical protein